MAELLLGPLLRYVSGTEATVWVETSEPCKVEVLGHSEPTFGVEGRHYALVRIEGLEPGCSYEYEVRLDGEVRWPEPGSELPPSTIRTIDPDSPIEICFGSCRVALPHTEPFVCSKDQHEDGREFDALHVLADEMSGAEPEQWPELLFLLGDQVYVDEGAPQTRARIRERRGIEKPPGQEVTDFEEYSWLYHEAWTDPPVRWLLSTVSTSMVWDDHDMSDDWNISRAWHEEMDRKHWWHRRAIAGITSYWVYQYIGNLSPHELDEDEIYLRVRGNRDATEELRRWAHEIDSTGAGTRWTFHRDLGRTRAIFIDSRAGRVLDDGHRSMVDEGEWRWVEEHAVGDFDHLLIATTVPYLLSPGFHHLQAWNERLCEGAWGRPLARASERIRRTLDFDHWASFGSSFARLRDLLEATGSGRQGRPPATITILSGDVHHAYLCEVAFPRGAAMKSAVYQAVCSPYRNPLDEHERKAIHVGFSAPFTAVTRALGRSAGAADPGIRWRLVEGPYFDNQVATLQLRGREAVLRLHKTIAGDESERELDCSFERRLSAA